MNVALPTPSDINEGTLKQRPGELIFYQLDTNTRPPLPTGRLTGELVDLTTTSPDPTRSISVTKGDAVALIEIGGLQANHHYRAELTFEPGPEKICFYIQCTG